ncbi:filaggrin-2-like [Pecten maximus]|uniref:filaggrin-2-like n=1 Tax=Pecten maximus TaxID=6579 RepID=UPI0014586D33|nr:filaggrin-2-like [Pecten maximus]
MDINTDPPESVHNSSTDNSFVETVIVPMTTTSVYEEGTMTPVTVMSIKNNDVTSASATELSTMSTTSGYVIETTEGMGESETTTSSTNLNKHLTMSSSIAFPEKFAQEPMTSTTITPTDNLTQEPVTSTTVLMTTGSRSTAVAKSGPTEPAEFDNQKQSSKGAKDKNTALRSRHEERAQTIRRLYELLRQYKNKFKDRPSRIPQNQDGKVVNKGHSRGRDTLTARNNRHHRIGGLADTSRMIRKHQQHRGHEKLNLNKLHHIPTLHRDQINRHEQVLGHLQEHGKRKSNIDKHITRGMLGDGNRHHETTHAQGQHETRHALGHHDTTHKFGHHDTTHALGHHDTTHALGHHGTTHALGHHGTTHKFGHHDTTHAIGHHDTTHALGRHATTHALGHQDTTHALGHQDTTHALGHHGTTQKLGGSLFSNRQRSKPSNISKRRNNALLKKLAHWFHLH